MCEASSLVTNNIREIFRSLAPMLLVNKTYIKNGTLIIQQLEKLLTLLVQTHWQVTNFSIVQYIYRGHTYNAVFETIFSLFWDGEAYKNCSSISQTYMVRGNMSFKFSTRLNRRLYLLYWKHVGRVKVKSKLYGSESW